MEIARWMVVGAVGRAAFDLFGQAVKGGEVGSTELAQAQRYLKAAPKADDVLTRATAIARRALARVAHQVLDPASFCAVFAGAVNGSRTL